MVECLGMYDPQNLPMYDFWIFRLCLAFFGASGYQKLEQDEFDFELGSKFTLPEKNNN